MEEQKAKGQIEWTRSGNESFNVPEEIAAPLKYRVVIYRLGHSDAVRAWCGDYDVGAEPGMLRLMHVLLDTSTLNQDRRTFHEYMDLWGCPTVIVPLPRRSQGDSAERSEVE